MVISVAQSQPVSTDPAAWLPSDALPILPVRRVPRTGTTPIPPAPVPGNKVNPPGNINDFGASPVYTVPGVGISGVVGGVWPQAGTTSQISAGGVAIPAVTGPCNGGYITNPANAASQAISVAENIYVDPVNLPGSTDAMANGTTVLIAAGATYTIPAIAAGATIWVNAATTGHKITVVVW